MKTRITIFLSVFMTIMSSVQAQTQVTNLDETKGYYLSSTTGKYWTASDVFWNPTTFKECGITHEDKSATDGNHQVWRFRKNADNSYTIYVASNDRMLSIANQDWGSFGAEGDTYKLYDLGDGTFKLVRTSDSAVLGSSLGTSVRVSVRGDNQYLAFSMEPVSLAAVPGRKAYTFKINTNKGYYLSSTATKYWTAFDEMWTPEYFKGSVVYQLDQSATDGTRQVWRFTLNADSTYSISTFDLARNLSFKGDVNWGVLGGTTKVNLLPDGNKIKLILKSNTNTGLSLCPNNPIVISETGDEGLSLDTIPVELTNVPNPYSSDIEVTNLDESKGYYFSSETGKVWTSNLATPSFILQNDSNTVDGGRQIWKFTKNADNTYKIVTLDNAFQMSWAAGNEWGDLSGTANFKLYSIGGGQYKLRKFPEFTVVGPAIKYNVALSVRWPQNNFTPFKLEPIGLNHVPGTVTGIEVSKKQATVNAFAGNGALNIQGQVGSSYVLYSVTGTIVKQGKLQANNTSFKVNAGIYILKLNNTVLKVIVP